MTDSTSVEKNAGKSTIPWIIAIFLALVLVGLLAWYALSLKKVPATTTTTGNKVVVSTTSESSNTESITVKKSAGYPTSSGQKNQENTFSFTAPTSWRTQVEHGEDQFCNDITEIYEKCFSLNFADQLGSPVSLSSTNSIKLLNLSTWRIVNDTDANPDIPTWGRPTIPSDKEARIKAIEALTPTSAITAEDISGKLFNPFLTNAAFGGLGNIQYLETSDGKLKGYGFIASLAQAPAYIPAGFFVLVGEVGNETYAIQGRLEINDALRSQLTLGNLPDKYSEPGYQYPEDARKQFDDAATVVKSFKID